MKIENNKISQLNRLISETIDRKRFQNAQGVPAAKGDVDKPSFSKEAQFLSKVMKTLQETPDIRADKVEELRKQIEEGTYEIKYEDLAKKMAFLLGLE
jgi:negative regulator of flagellin synthesis FlgM